MVFKYLNSKIGFKIFPPDPDSTKIYNSLYTYHSCCLTRSFISFPSPRITNPPARASERSCLLDHHKSAQRLWRPAHPRKHNQHATQSPAPPSYPSKKNVTIRSFAPARHRKRKASKEPCPTHPQNVYTDPAPKPVAPSSIKPPPCLAAQNQPPALVHTPHYPSQSQLSIYYLPPLVLILREAEQSIESIHGAAGSARRRGGGGGCAARGVGVGGLVAVREVHHRRQRARGLQRAGSAGDVAHPQPAVRRRLQLPPEVPLRRVQHPDEARPGQLRRHRHVLLPDLRRRPRARRDRHGVHGQQHRRAGGAQHQRVGQRRRQEGAPVLPVVRPVRRLPHLHHHLERQEHHLQGGRPLHPELQALRGPAVPGRQAHVRARHALGRQLLGHAAGEGEGRLGRRALRRLLPPLLRRRLHSRRRRPPAQLPRRHRQVDEPAARRRRVGHRRVGEEELHALRLLRRWLEVPAGIPRRVLAQLIGCSVLG